MSKKAKTGPLREKTARHFTDLVREEAGNMILVGFHQLRDDAHVFNRLSSEPLPDL